MCQMSVMLEEKGGEPSLVMKNVTGLEVTADGVQLAMMFEKPKAVKGVYIDRIDFLGGKLILRKSKAE
jgi:predicted RNA-binding protein